MSSSNAVRFLQTGSDEYALALEQSFSNAVVASFRNSTMFYDGNPAVIARKTITSGFSHQFLQFGEDLPPEEHDAGDELLGQQFEIAEGAITLDRPIVKHHDIGEDQIDVSHFDTFAPVGTSIGRSIAIEMDQRIIRAAILSARTAAATKNGLTIHSGGNRVERVAANVATAYPVSSTGAQNFRDDVATLARQMDEDAVPETGRYLCITPYIRQVLSKDTTIFSKDFGAGNPNINARTIGLLEGFQVLPTSNHIPSTNVVTGPTKYQGNFTASGADGQPVAVALCGAMDGRAAVGMVQLGAMVRRMIFDTRRRTFHMHAKLFAGMGTLHPYCAGEIAVPTS